MGNKSNKLMNNEVSTPTSVTAASLPQNKKSYSRQKEDQQSFNLQELKKIDVETQYIIFGYYRLNHDNIPDLIIYITLSYYYLNIIMINDYFFNAGSLINISNDNKIAKTNHDDYSVNTVYGNYIIDLQQDINRGILIYQWKIKILSKYVVTIGIDNFECRSLNSRFDYDKSKECYSYYVKNGFIYSWNAPNINLHNNKSTYYVEILLLLLMIL